MTQVAFTQRVSIESIERTKELVAIAQPRYERWLGAPDFRNKFLSLRNISADDYKQNIKQLKKIVSYVDGNAIENIIHLGIGGSGLGAELLADFLAYTQESRVNLMFYSSFDQRLGRVLPTLDLSKTVFVFVSKSFATDEMLWQLSLVKGFLQQVGANSHFFAITSEPQKASDLGFEEQKILLIPAGVGGRFSVWSSVSASVVAAFGLEVFESFLAGAKDADAVSVNVDSDHNIALKMALQACHCLQGLKLPTRAICAYHPALEKLVPYLQQLEMESLGKRVDGSGQKIDGLTCAVIWGGVGTNIQHSIFQYIMQHGLQTPLDFISVDGDSSSAEKYKAHLNAQVQVLKNGYEGSQPQDHIMPNEHYQLFQLQDLSAKSLGYLLSLYEHKVVWLASMLGLDPFTQPGVQAAKLILK